MPAIALTLLIQTTLTVSGAQDFATAYQQSKADGRPLLVLVGADWCPGCQVMKRQTMPGLQQAGNLSNVAYAVVDVDREKELSERIMQGAMIPQLILYKRAPDGWKRTQLTGAHKAEDVHAFIRGTLGQTGLASLRPPVTGRLGRQPNASYRSVSNDPAPVGR